MGRGGLDRRPSAYLAAAAVRSCRQRPAPRRLAPDSLSPGPFALRPAERRVHPRSRCTRRPPPGAAPGGPPPSGYPPGGFGPSGQQPAGGYGQIPGPPTGFPGAQPAPGGYQQGPGGPGYPGGPGGYGAPPKKSKLWLWLVLAVVLVLIVGGGVTLAVTQPWSGDDTSAGSGDGDGAGEGDGDDGGDDGGDEGPGAVVTGDLDGDGLGDVLANVQLDYDRVQVVEGISDGETFATNEYVGNPDTDQDSTLYVDWNNDGALEELSYDYSAGTNSFALRSSDGLPGSKGVKIPFRSLSEYGDYMDPVVESGDFDGDGNADVVVFGQQDKVVESYVMLGAGDGTFSAPTLWATVPNALIDELMVWPGDFDGDGDDDLMVHTVAEKLKPKDYREAYVSDIDMGFTQLTSGGDTFETGGVTPSERYPGSNPLLVADLGGEKDVVLELELDYSGGLAIGVMEFLEGRFVDDAASSSTVQIGEATLSAAALSDVDGDGDDDLIYVYKPFEGKRFSDMTVSLSDEGTFGEGAAWGSLPRCPDDYCDLYLF
ncbi:FG-GAP repeat domain-containing protein [Nocardioides sambongensis]|uniref:FG-GAP repeat domain-containing protein n=1 Tax=Nocardioides sambongensis TaxID=2589074 RepID=UPI00112EBD60|nr:VCBS repeat-containing protein [Nocardioides sambongensis]